MSVQYPTSIDSFVNPAPTNYRNAPSLAGQMDDKNAAIIALETKLGVNGSAVTTTVDYKLSGIPSGDKSSSLTGTESPTNKTIAGTTNKLGAVTMDLGGDATGDLYYNNGGVLARLPIGTSEQVLTVIGGVPTYASPSVTITAPQAFNMSAAKSGAALPYFYCDVYTTYGYDGSVTLSTYNQTYGYQQRAITSDWASAVGIQSVIILNGFLYVLVKDNSGTPVYRLYRYSASNLSAGGTLVTFSGQSLTATTKNIIMLTDSVNIWFNYQAGNSTNDYLISKYTISGTTLTYVATTTCGSTANVATFLVKIDTNGNIWAWNENDYQIRKYSAVGTLVYTSPVYSVYITGFFNYNNTNQYSAVAITSGILAVLCDTVYIA